MGLGLSTGNGEGGAFLPLLKYDARSGRMVISQRKQGADGMWVGEDEDITRQQPAFAVDFRTIEVGWIWYSKPPSFALVPLGQPMPAKPNPEYKQGFRVKVAGKVLAAPDGGIVREFSSTSKAVVGAMNDLHTAYEAAPEAQKGMIPVVRFVDVKPVKTTTPQGTTTNFAPVFEIVQWVERPADVLGEATVPLPGAKAAPAAAPAPAPAPTGGGKVLDDAIPFSPGRD